MLKQIVLIFLFLSIAVNAEVTREDIDAVQKQLEAAVQVENRCTTSSDCTAAPTGSRACGGPNGYVVYAIKSSNARMIRLLATKTVDLERQYNLDNGVISICSMIMPPTPVCDKTSKCSTDSTVSPFEPATLE